MSVQVSLPRENVAPEGALQVHINSFENLWIRFFHNKMPIDWKFRVFSELDRQVRRTVEHFFECFRIFLDQSQQS
jgi:hypothetical protein